MIVVLLLLQIVITLALVGVILMQRSEGGALGIGGGPSGLMSGRAAGDALTRATSILAAAFFASSLLLTVLFQIRADEPSLLESVGPDVLRDAPAAGDPLDAGTVEGADAPAPAPLDEAAEDAADETAEDDAERPEIPIDELDPR